MEIRDKANTILSGEHDDHCEIDIVKWIHLDKQGDNYNELDEARFSDRRRCIISLTIEFIKSRKNVRFVRRSRILPNLI